MKRTITLLALCLAGCAPLPTSPGPRDVVLFNGRDLTGWVRRGGAAEYRVEDGAIVGETRPDQPNTFLCTERTFSDFELTLEFNVSPELNSGVQIRSHARPEGQLERVYGYQIEIDPSARAWTGGLYEEAGRAWLKDLKDNDAARAAFVQGSWNSMRVVCQGDRFRTWINGVPCVDTRDALTREGFIALQVHGVGHSADRRRVSWRNIRLREL